jgi:hypothetical protein
VVREGCPGDSTGLGEEVWSVAQGIAGIVVQRYKDGQQRDRMTVQIQDLKWGCWEGDSIVEAGWVRGSGAYERKH